MLPQTHPGEEDDKRRLALSHVQDLLSAWVACRDSNRHPFKLAVLHDKAEEMLGYLLRSFPGEPASRDEISAVYTAKVNFLRSDVLAEVPDRMVPFVVVMTALRQHKIMLDPSQVKNWNKLVERFNILAA